MASSLPTVPSALTPQTQLNEFLQRISVRDGILESHEGSIIRDAFLDSCQLSSAPNRIVDELQIRPLDRI
jgi:hypothetical protein